MFCIVCFVPRKVLFDFCLLSQLYSILNKLSEYTDFYISKKITSYTLLLAFKIAYSRYCILNLVRVNIICINGCITQILGDKLVQIDQVYSNTRVSTQFNTSQDNSTRVNTNQQEPDTNQHQSTRIKTSPTRVNTNQDESDTSQHESRRVRHKSTRVNQTKKLSQFIVVLVGKV